MSKSLYEFSVHANTPRQALPAPVPGLGMAQKCRKWRARARGLVPPGVALVMAGLAVMGKSVGQAHFGHIEVTKVDRGKSWKNEILKIIIINY